MVNVDDWAEAEWRGSRTEIGGYELGGSPIKPITLASVPFKCFTRHLACSAWGAAYPRNPMAFAFDSEIYASVAPQADLAVSKIDGVNVLWEAVQPLTAIDTAMAKAQNVVGRLDLSVTRGN